MNTIVANKAEEKLGDRPTATTNEYDARPGETMLALRWYGDRDVRVEEVPAPTITESTDAVVKVTGTTVCGSDLHLYHKEIMQLQKGEILGHEFMGIVDEVGSEVTSIKKGDRVVASFQIAYVYSVYAPTKVMLRLTRTNPVVANVNSVKKASAVCATAPIRLLCRKSSMVNPLRDYSATPILQGALLVAKPSMFGYRSPASIFSKSPTMFLTRKHCI